MKKAKRTVSILTVFILALSILVLPAFAIDDALTNSVAVDSAATDSVKTYWNYGTVNTPGTALRSALTCTTTPILEGYYSKAIG